MREWVAMPGRRAWLAACMLGAGACRSVRSAEAEAWRNGFEQGLADWPGLGSVWGAHNHRFLPEPGVRGQLMRVLFRQGSIDPGSMTRRGLPRSGTGFRARVIAGGSDDAVLRYRLRFASGFDFVRGGKLPGLFGGQGHSGGRIPDGSDGLSLRLMWRERGQGEIYAYLPTSLGQGSSLLRGRFAFNPGHWHAVEQQVRLNTPGRDDGHIRLLFDGREAGEARGLRFRDVPSLRLDGVFVETFFGGNDDSWAARADTHIDLAEFEVVPGQRVPR